MVLTCWPPAPPALYVSIFNSSCGMSKVISSSENSGITSTEQKDVCLLPEGSNGEILINLWTPFSPFNSP